jgi:hypothetical protein
MKGANEVTTQGTSTYSSIEKAKSDLDDERGGRWAGPQLPTRHITGTLPDGAPLPCPAWSAAEALVPPEPPLNEDVNWLPDMTTVSGQDRATLQPPTLAEQIAQLNAAIAQNQALLNQLIAEAQTNPEEIEE